MRTAAHVWLFGLGSAMIAAACAAGNSSSPAGNGNAGTGNGAAGSSGTGTAGDLGTAGTSGTGTAGTSGGNSCALTLCGSDCVNTANDANNCGACGIPCAGGRTCQNSQCQCQPGLLDCNGSCVASDATHCGNCTTACQTNQVCSNNACSSSCAGSQTLCGTACVDTTSSDANCGTCGHACGANQQCTASTCTDISTGGTAGAGGTGGGSAGGAGMSGAGGASGSAGSAGSAGSGGGPTQPILVTSAPNAYWNTSGTLTTVTTGNANVTVNDGTVMQSWEGFGGAFNEMSWNYLQMLSQADRDKAMQLLFGTDGAHFTMGRIPIGASDYALARYTDDETANDTNLNSFSITQDMKYLIPYVKAAQAINGSIRFWASPWTPPTWMKTNSGTVNGTSCAKVGATAFDGGCMVDNAANLTAHAKYFVKWVQAYGQQGITIETVAPQNEPNYAQGYPSALWASPLFTKFVGQYLGPAFTAAGLNTKIMLGTMSNSGGSADPTIVTAVMGDATAKSYIKVIGMQWGMQTGVTGAKQYNLPIWQTEHKCGNYPWNPSGSPAYKEPAPNDQAYGVETWGLIRDWIKAGVTAYSAWNMVLDTVGKGNDMTRQWSQNSLLVVDTGAKKLILTPAYYVFRHFGQYVKPGAKVVGTTGGDAMAFKNPDGSIVAILYNSGGAGTYIVQIAGKKLQFSMPGSGWATVVSQ